MIDPQKRRSPAGAPHTEQGSHKKQQLNHTVFREFVSIAIVGILLAVLFVDSVVGMSGQFGPTQEVGYMLAGVGDDGR